MREEVGELIDDCEELLVSPDPQQELEECRNIGNVWTDTQVWFELVGKVRQLFGDHTLLGYEDDRWLAVRQPTEQPRFADSATAV